MVGEDGATAHAGEGAIRAQHDRAQVIVIAHAAEHDVGAGYGLARRGRMAAVELLAPGAGLGLRAVVDRDAVARRGQVAGHG